MLDTVTVGTPLEVPGNTRALRARGWDFGTCTRGSDFNAWANTEVCGVRLHWGAGYSWLKAECSLPRLLYGDNSRVLTSWNECEAAMMAMVGIAAEAVGVQLPPLPEWRMSRADPVWAWDSPPEPYLTALRLATIPRLERASYDGGVAWRTPAKHTRVRVYDKRKERKADVALPLRVECEVRPKRATWRVDEERVGREVGAWGPHTALGALRGQMGHLGLTRPIPSGRAVLGVLQAAHGRVRGQNVYNALLNALDAGGWDLVAGSRATVRRHLRLLREAGVSCVSLDGELPPLLLPSTCR